MTERAQIAAQALAGWLASYPSESVFTPAIAEAVACNAVAFADALLVELARPKVPGAAGDVVADAATARAGVQATGCGYCGEQHGKYCPTKIHHDILMMMNELDKEICLPDHNDGGRGISHHLQAVWRFRDRVNTYFQHGPVMVGNAKVDDDGITASVNAKGKIDVVHVTMAEGGAIISNAGKSYEVHSVAESISRCCGVPESALDEYVDPEMVDAARMEKLARGSKQA
jgi:hypothetical protein